VWPLQPTTGGQWGALVAVLLLEQLSNALYDLKDLDADRRNGIQTLALLLGHRRFLLVEGAVAAVGLSVVVGAWTPASPGLAASFALHLAAIVALVWRPFDRWMTVGLDGVYSTILLLAVLSV